MVSYKGRVVSAGKLAALWQLAAFGQSADIGASGPVLRDLSSDDIWGWARSGRFGTTRIDHRGPRKVRGPWLVDLQPAQPLANTALSDVPQ